MVLASNNQGKVDEFKFLLKSFDVEILSLKDMGIVLPPETGRTFSENSLQKAQFVFKKTGLPALADDSGFCLDGLNGFPGLFSSRFSIACQNLQNELLKQDKHIETSHYGDDSPCFKLLNNMVGDNKKAYFTTYLSYIDQDGKEYGFEGVVDGSFVFPQKGQNGFGYDPVFIPDGYDKTFAEMTSEEKQSNSHRSRAIKKFMEFYENSI
jgi:XTP/dITP diphosphohydrolase